MNGDQWRETVTSQQAKGVNADESAVGRARMLLEASAVRDAHEILEREVERSSLGTGSGAVLDPARETEILTLLLESCCGLGHQDHWVRYWPVLRERCGPASSLAAEGRVRAMTVLARVLILQGKYREALTQCAEVSTESLEGSEARTAVRFLSRVEEAHFRLGELEQAENAIARALRRAEEEGDAALQGNAWGLMAGVMRVRGRFAESLRMYREAARLHRRAGDYTGLARDNLNRGWLLNRSGLLADSVAAFDEAFRHATAAGLADLALRADLGLGMAAARHGDWTRARSRLLPVWRRARRHGMRREATLALEFLGEAATLAGRRATARRALSLCRRSASDLAACGDLVLECALRESLLALDEKRFADAEERALTASALAVEQGMIWEEAQAKRLLGTSLVLRNKIAAGRAALRAAEESFHAMGETFEVLLVRAWLEFVKSVPARFSDETPEPGTGVAEQDLASVYGLPGFHPSWLIRKEATSSDGVPRTEPLGSNRPEPDETERIQLRTPNNDGGKEGDAVASRARTSRSRGRPLAGAGDRRPDPAWSRLGILTRTPAVLRLLLEAEAVAGTGDSALLLGETGTGKDLLARGIHELSGRRGQFIPFSCAACPVELVESELFGAERGAYTGADRRREGLAALAAGGTLFLDEIGDLPARAQGSVLRFLDQGEVRALGSHVIRRLRVGIVAATHHPLYNRVETDHFRRDLYYRLAQKVIEVPPLRERPDDLDLLLEMLWSRLTGDAELPIWLRKERTLETLRSHSWPGNVRELEHFTRRVRLHGGREIPPDEIHRDLQAPQGGSATSRAPGPKEVERALAASGGNRRNAAAVLGISRAKLYRLLREREKS